MVNFYCRSIRIAALVKPDIVCQFNRPSRLLGWLEHILQISFIGIGSLHPLPNKSVVDKPFYPDFRIRDGKLKQIIIAIRHAPEKGCVKRKNFTQFYNCVIAVIPYLKAHLCAAFDILRVPVFRHDLQVDLILPERHRLIHFESIKNVRACIAAERRSSLYQAIRIRPDPNGQDIRIRMIFRYRVDLSRFPGLIFRLRLHRLRFPLQRQYIGRAGSL